MLAATLKKDSIEKIKKVLKFVISSKYCDFYRKKYNNGDFSTINSYNDFIKIPYLLKDEILAVGVHNRIYGEEKNIAYYSFSSGTTNYKAPLIMPHSDLNFKSLYLSEESDLKTLKVKKILILHPPLSPVLLRALAFPPKNAILIPGDTRNFDLTAKLAKELEIEGIHTTVTILEFFASRLKEIKFNFDKIKWILISGEFCTNQKFEFFKSLFPKTRLKIRYGASEAGGLRGYRCDYLYNEPPNIYHPSDFCFLEIVDENNKVVLENEIGEIIHTDLQKRIFPLIRYKTGDMGAIQKKICRCGNDYIIKLGGRTTYDFLRFQGVTLHTQTIENSLNQVREFLEPIFQMHVYEKKIKEKLLPQLEIWVLLKRGHKKTDFIESLLKENISKNLYLTPSKNLDYLVRQNVFLPLKIKFIEEWQESAEKSKKIISHLE